MRVRITREAVVGAAVELLRTDSPLNARAVAAALRCSTQPIFRCFASMEDLRAAALTEIHARYLAFLADYAARSPEPAYKASGMGYIAFASTEPNWFRVLFMRSRAEGEASPENADWEPTLAAVSRNTGLGRDEAERFHLEMWAVVHGLAVMQATNYLRLGEAEISRMISDAYRGIRKQWEENHERD